MQCTSCGHGLSGTEAFCAKCGANVQQMTSPPLNRNCPNCGAEIAEDSKFCAKCGFQLSGTPNYTATAPTNDMSFTDAIKICLTQKYAKVDGRARRAEYWWLYLLSVILSVAEAVLVPLAIVFFLAQLALVIPTICAATRRLHDVGKSGWWQLIGLTIIGLIPLIIWLCQKGQEGPNQYGPDPLA